MQIKTIKDYYDKIATLFPEVPKEDIKRILNYGWKSLYMCNSAGADTVIKDRKGFWCYIGFLKRTALEYFNYYIKKLARKIRILYKRKNIEWDGYYYFTLNDEAYANYCGQKNTKGRKKKKFDYGEVYLYQILDECRISCHIDKYIFRIPYNINVGYKIHIPKLITDKAELIITRDPLKFKDILIYNNEYDTI